MELTTVQNGSDIRGIAISHGEQLANLTPKEMELIAQGMVRWLRDEKKIKRNAADKPLKIGIGHDSRLSAVDLKEALSKKFLQQTIDVIDFGLATTPAMFMATQFSQYDCDATIMITASHLPYYFNGLKIFTKAGGAEKEDIAYILSHTDPLATLKTGSITPATILDDYSQDLVEKIKKGMNTTESKPLAGFHIVVDAGNGAGGFFAKQVLQALGADTTGSQFLEPDGYFPNHMPNPDNKEAMASIQQAVITHHADLGVIFDTDVDRSAVVDSSGQVLNRNNLIAVLASIVLENHAGASIVTNSPISSHLKEFIEIKGGKQIRYISGYRNVINKMIALNDSGQNVPLAIETSGHAAFKENFYLDDGAYIIAKILMLLPQLRKEEKTLSDLISTLKQPVEAQEIRFAILAADFRTYGEQVIQKMRMFVEETPYLVIDNENEEGVRVDVGHGYGSGWFLLRMSLHEPLLVLQIENDHMGMNKNVLKQLVPFFSQHAQLVIDQLTTSVG